MRAHPRSVLLFLFLSVCHRASAAPPTVAADHSLAPAAYVEQGVPPHGRMWTGEDYVQAVRIYKQMAEADPTKLPRYGSPTSGALFERMVSADNLALLANGDLAGPQRLTAAVSLVQALRGMVFEVYGPAATPERTFDAEIVELMRHSLQVSLEMQVLMNELFASLPADDPDRETRMKGWRKSREGFTTAVIGTLVTLTEHDLFRTSELLRLADDLEKMMPELFPLLTPTARKELPILLQRMIDEEQDAAIKERLNRIATAVADPKPAAPLPATGATERAKYVGRALAVDRLNAFFETYPPVQRLQPEEKANLRAVLAFDFAYYNFARIAPFDPDDARHRGGDRPEALESGRSLEGSRRLVWLQKKGFY